MKKRSNITFLTISRRLTTTRIILSMSLLIWFSNNETFEIINLPGWCRCKGFFEILSNMLRKCVSWSQFNNFISQFSSWINFNIVQTFTTAMSRNKVDNCYYHFLPLKRNIMCFLSPSYQKLEIIIIEKMFTYFLVLAFIVWTLC